MNLARLAALGTIGLTGVAAMAAQTPSPWQQPAAALASQIADLVGPGQAGLTLRNRSSIPDNELPTIRKALVEDLRAHGVLAAGPDSANSIRVTLSESATERLWVAEVVEGSESQVTMLDLGPLSQPQAQPAVGLMLRRSRVFRAHMQVLAALESDGWLLAVEPERLLLYQRDGKVWTEEKHLDFVAGRMLSRDPRAIVQPVQLAGGSGFQVFVGAAQCSGSFGVNDPSGTWRASCSASDDPWIIAPGNNPGPSDAAGGFPSPQPTQSPSALSNFAAAAETPTPSLKAFYNSARDYFSGIVIPSPAVNLPPFYSAAFIPRPAGGAALLIGGIDGEVQLLENGGLSPVNGARDWGSDFAALHSGCAAGTQILASSSGQAASDSLRAYQVPGLEAVPASEPLAMDGTVTALWTAPDGKSVLAVVRSAEDEYEVDRVTASCN